MSKRASKMGWLGAAATIAAVCLPATAQARFAPPDTGPPSARAVGAEPSGPRRSGHR
jgi:hypothetical protein